MNKFAEEICRPPQQVRLVLLFRTSELFYSLFLLLNFETNKKKVFILTRLNNSYSNLVKVCLIRNFAKRFSLVRQKRLLLRDSSKGYLEYLIKVVLLI